MTREKTAKDVLSATNLAEPHSRRALDEWVIALKVGSSPQAKGRVERMKARLTSE
jgi:hypothetical protein